MPEEELNNSGPGEKGPPDDIPEEQTSPAEEKTSDISEPTMDDASSLAEGADVKEDIKDTAGKTESIEESSSDEDDELSQEEIDQALETANGTESKNTESPNEYSEKNIGADDTEAIPIDERRNLQATSQENISDNDINIIKSKEFEEFAKAATGGVNQSIDMLLDVTLPISIELGRTSMPIEDILNLGPGSVVELNRLAGEPVDLLVNDKLIARGEVVVVDENFGIRVTHMVSQEERLKSLL